MNFCSDCKNKNCPEEMPDPNSMACKNFKGDKITNGDKIRQMSNRELASFLSSKTICPVCPAQTEKCIGNADKVCIKNWLAYLNAPAESEVEDE